jgi:hypothetical protein
MAKRIILEAYTFNPSTKVVTVNGKYLRMEQVILITNVTKSTVLFNFADANYKAANWSATIVDNVETTTITLDVSTTGMSASDKLSILVEESNESFQPAEAQMDPVGKFRMSTPQSLIDTDFEYGTQPTKWESLALMNNRPSAFYDNTTPIVPLTIVANGTRLITVTLPFYASTATTATGSPIITGVTAGAPIFVGMTVMTTVNGIPAGTTVVGIGAVANSFVLSAPATSASAVTFYIGYPVTYSSPLNIQDTTAAAANGWVIPHVLTVSTSVVTGFSYWARTNVATGNIFDSMKTYVYVGSYYSGAGYMAVNTAGTEFTYSGSLITVTTTNAHGFAVGSGIFVTNITASTNPPIGSWFVKSVITSNQFTFDAVNTPTGTITPTQLTLTGTAATAGAGLTVNVLSVNNGTVTSVSVSALGSNYVVGDMVTLNAAGSANCILKILAVTPFGAATVGQVLQLGIYQPGTSYSVVSATGTLLGFNCSSLYAHTWGSSIHRPFDGGVSFTAGLPYHGNQLVRQTRRYFRYQSGKGIQFATGSNLCSPFIVDNVSISGTTVTVTTKFGHNVYIGAAIKVSGADLAALNGTGVSGGATHVIIASPAPTETTFSFTIGSNLGTVASAAGNITVQPIRWYGASVRLGMFDSQNGFFFQYDGQEVSAIRRSSTLQLAGYISQLGQGGQTVTGIGTRWSSQLITNDYIVIRGQSHTIISIESDTQMTIFPDYKGLAIIPPAQCIISKTVDLKIPQSAWNIDKCDGTGASGFNLDVSKMQMWMIDYAWYGAGAIRWGFKNQRGEVMYVHRLAHGNAQTEAYMRSGNLPARYEVNTNYPYTTLAASISASDTSLTVVNAAGYPAANGCLVLTKPGNTGATVEYIKYTTLTGNVFSGLTRGCTPVSNPVVGPGGLTAGGGGSAVAYTVSATAPIAVTLYSPQSANTISHWGSAVIMDGRYDDDKSLVFVAGMQTPIISIPPGGTQPLISIRISPSVDNGITGLLGQREIVNKMQLIMRSMAVLSSATSSLLITLRLNGYIMQGTGTTLPAFGPAGGSSLAQVCYHAQGNQVFAGETVFGFYPNGTTGGVTVQDLSQVRDIGNSIQGGGNTLTVPMSANNKYPDGPDIITACVTNLSASATVGVIARINWTEAQA